MPTFPSVLAGQRITATLLNSMVPLTIVKPGDQSVTNSTVLVNDNDLVLPVVASGSYIVAAFINYEGGTQGSADFKFQFTVPASGTLKINPTYVDTSGNFHTGNNLVAATTLTAGTNGAGVPRNLVIAGTFVNSVTAGNIQLQWAQNTGNATATIVHVGSSLALWRTS